MSYTKTQQEIVRKYTHCKSIEEFLSYCVTHSMTDNALFSYQQLYAIASLGDPAKYGDLAAKIKRELDAGHQKAFSSENLLEMVAHVRRYNNACATI